MAGFHTKTFAVHDDYMTPPSAWRAIHKYIPKNKVIWDPFYGDGTSGHALRDLGYEVIHKPVDFFRHNFGDIIVTNPPFSRVADVLNRLAILGKPFILIMPVFKLITRYFADLFGNENKSPIQLLVPRRRIQFIKMAPSDTKRKTIGPTSFLKRTLKATTDKKACNFDCFYYCWKCNLPRDIIWLEDTDV